MGILVFIFFGVFIIITSFFVPDNFVLLSRILGCEFIITPILCELIWRINWLGD